MVTNRVYAVTGAKGGVGKTTASINLGALLATGGYSAVVVEVAASTANLVDFFAIDVDATLHNVLADDASITDAVYETDSGLAIVPSGSTLDRFVATDRKRLADIVETLQWHHDIVLLDTPAGLSEATARPLKLADDVLLVSTPRVASVRNVSNTKELAERLDAPVRGLILTKSGTGASPGPDEISAWLDIELLGHVPEDDAVLHAQDSGTPVVQDAPNSDAAVAYQRISEQLIDTAKASTDSTTDAPMEAATPGPGNTGPTSHQTDDQAHGHTAASVETTDGGRAVHRRGASAVDGDPTSPSPASQEDRADRPTDDTVEALDSLDTPASEPRLSDFVEDSQTASVLDGTHLIDTESGPVAGPAESVDTSDSAADTSQSATDDLDQDGDTSEHDTDGLSKRMRSLFGL